MCQICCDFNPFQPDFLHANASDQPGDTSTDAVLGVGQTLNGDLTIGDQDWFRIEVTKGETYVLSTSDGTEGSVKDTLLVLYDRLGREVMLNDDDGPGFHAELTFEATSKVYYAAVTTYQAHFGFPATDEGSYRLRLTEDGAPGTGTPVDPEPSVGLPVYSNDQIADQLVSGYWEDSGRDARGFDVDVSERNADEIYVDLSGLDAAGTWFAEQALAIWSDVSGLRFSQEAPPRGTPVGIRFEDDNSGAYASATVRNDGTTANVFVNISKAWIAGDHYDFDSYALQTYLHEIGHALGLGHAGSYNTGEGLSVNYTAHAEYANDSWQSTVMSYFSQVENTEVDGTKAYLMTPMAADILAVQQIYGKAGDLRAGDTVYGEGSTAGDQYDNLSKLSGEMAFTILDDGGRDLLDVSATEIEQRIDLRPETFSDIGGQAGNMSIARGTWLEEVRSGSGADRVTGNKKANLVVAGGSGDAVDGLRGADTLKGGGGDDTLSGDVGRDMVYGGAGADRVIGGAGADHLFGGTGADRLFGEGGRDFLRGGPGADRFVFAPGAGFDRIVDYRDGVDEIDLRAFDLSGFRAVADAARQRNDFVVIELDGVKIEIKGMDLSDLSPSDFLL